MIWQGSGWAKLSISETRYWAKSTVYPKACGKWCCVVNHPLPSISIQYSYKHLSLRRMSRFLHNNHNNVYVENKEVNISYFSCPLLHRTAGDTERRYHLRYYKTGMCVHDTDNRWESYDSRNNFGIVDHKCIFFLTSSCKYQTLYTHAIRRPYGILSLIMSGNCVIISG